MFSIAPPFWCQSDYLTRLQTDFAGSSSADQSFYAIGSGTTVGTVTVYAGYLEVILDSTTTKTLSWSDASMELTGSTNLCAEFLVTLEETTANPPSGVKFAQLTFGSSGGIDFQINGYGGAVTGNEFQINESGSIYSGTTDAAFSPTDHHFAVQFRSTGVFDIYIDGSRVVTSRAYTGGANHTVQLGGSGTAGQTVTCKFTGVRVRRADVYSGASVTPPSSPADWGSAYQ